MVVSDMSMAASEGAAVCMGQVLGRTLSSGICAGP